MRKPQRYCIITFAHVLPGAIWVNHFQLFPFPACLRKEAKALCIRNKQKIVKKNKSLNMFSKNHTSSISFLLVAPFRIALTGPTVQPIRQAEASVFPSFFSQLKSWLFFVWIFSPWDFRKIIKTAAAYQSDHFGLENFTSVFSKVGRNFSLKKILNFLSFLVLLYVSGHFKQKKFFKHFQTDKKISLPKYMDKLRELAMKFFSQSEKFWKKNFCFSFLVLFYVSGHFKQFFFWNYRKILQINKVNSWFLTISQK